MVDTHTLQQQPRLSIRKVTNSDLWVRSVRDVSKEQAPLARSLCAGREPLGQRVGRFFFGLRFGVGMGDSAMARTTR